MPRGVKRLPAETIYYIRCAVSEFNGGLILTSIWVLYFSIMKLNLLEVAWLSIVATVSTLILEIPTGILADVYSRRLSVILGGGFIGIAFAMEGVYPIFAIAMMGHFVEAIGDTCVSGALQAWITDEVGIDRVGRIFLRGKQVSMPAYWIGVVLSVVLAALFNSQVPIVLGGALWLVMTIFLILFMPETNFRRPGGIVSQDHTMLLRQFETTVRMFGDGVRLVRGSSILLLLSTAQVFGSAFLGSFYRLSRANILQGFSLPVLTLPLLGELGENVWFGVYAMLQGVFCFIGIEGLRRKIDFNRVGAAARVLFGLHLLMLAGVFVFAVTGNLVLAIIAWVIVSGLQEMGGPITETWLNQNIPSSIRSTVLSMNSQVGAFGEMGGNTSLGAFGDRFGVRSALGLSALLVVPMLVVYGRSVRPSSNARQD